MQKQYRLNDDEAALIEFVRSLNSKQILSVVGCLVMESLHGLQLVKDKESNHANMDLIEVSSSLYLSQVLRKIALEKEQKQ